ncbi:hypothetical protein DM860_015913 [Cuscuta australis]|uniref:Uncharacterized protein n=1 Tax=Cuscuta australis TaxID=267555 RepID=A0A328DZX1_9ASTE|nr:hypothetical protein DM860_015913 [Cuscuta australis]
MSIGNIQNCNNIKDVVKDYLWQQFTHDAFKSTMGTKKKKLDMLGATGHLNLQSSDVLKLTMSSYEKQRLERIELNAAKMKALGLEEKARLLLKRHSELNNQKKLQNKKGKKALEGAEEHRPNNNVHDGKELDASDAIIDDKDLNNVIPQTIVRKN